MSQNQIAMIASSNVEKYSCENCEYNGNTLQGLKSHNTKKHKTKNTEIEVNNTKVQNQNIPNCDNSVEKRSYVLNAIKSVNKALDCNKRPPVRILDKTTGGEAKVSNATMTMELNLGLFEHKKSHLGSELSCILFWRL